MINNHHIQNNKGIWLVTLIFMVVGSLLVSGCGAEEPKVYRVGILNGFPPFSEIVDGFKAEMTELGYVEDENIVYDVQEVQVDPVKEERILDQFVADEVDLIFAFATESALAAKEATQGTDIPVVFAHAGLEGNDLVESVQQPGGNVTGTRFAGPGNTLRRFELLLEMVPQAERVYITYNENYPANQASLEPLRSAASSRGVTLVEEPLSSVAEIEANLEGRAASGDIGMDAILIMPDDFSQSPVGWPLVSEFAAEHKVPIGGAAPFTADTGALFSYVPDFYEVGQLAAPLADKVLKGTPAGTIPVVTPEDRLRLNYIAVEELGLAVDEGLLSQATEIIR